ncbi:MAG: ABC transporter ATP-binding protein [Lachnospiraceae bacterium]|nr:ABC transporter ATP-binding protein [Lachnospiraceae bacterium]
MLEVKNLSRRYGSFDAVKDLNFKIESGGIYGLLGPNGAGKSTTMNMITGYLAPTSGNVLIDGHDITKEPLEAKKRTGYLPEVPPLYPDLTVREYLNFVSELKKIKSSSRSGVVGELMDRTKLYPVEGKLIRNLSKGFRQRVGIAAALIGYPDLIILDEPTAGLDPAQIIEIRELILSLKDKHTVILSSHILQEISAVCDHIMVISHGKLMANDTPERIADSMNVENRTELIIKAEEISLKEALNGVGFITSYTVETGNDGLLKTDIKSAQGSDIREALFDLCAGRGFKIFDMRSDIMSLEDVYMKLTSDEYAFSLQENIEDKDPSPALRMTRDDKSGIAADNAAEITEEDVPGMEKEEM